MTRVKRVKTQTTVYLTDDQQERLRRLSERTRVPIAAYIREGIDVVLGRYEPAPAAAPGDPPAAARG